MRKRILSMSIVSLFAIFALAACGKPDESVQPTVTRIPDVVNAPVLTPEGATPVPEADQGQGENTAGSPAAEGSEPGSGVTIDLEDIFFEPNEFTIASGSPVTVTLVNVGGAPHNFAIDALEISVDVAPGETKTVEISADPGEYEFYCDVPGHREAGMVGTMTVT